MKIIGKWQTREVSADGGALLPELSLKLMNHSPDGFAWGYGGSGPAQLALSILLKVVSQDEALRLHQDFKWDVITQLPQSDFEIDIDVKEWAISRMTSRAGVLD